jgi:hypothetical protein
LASFFLFPSSADIIQNSAVGNFSPKREGTKTKAAIGADKLVTTQIWKLKNCMYLFSDVFSLPLHFEYYEMFKS